jgi:hypothetical protein
VAAGGGAGLLIIGVVLASRASPPSPPPPTGGGCCPQGQVFTGEMTGSIEQGVTGTLVPVCALPADEPYPCPCGCTNLADCGGYTIYSNLGPGLNRWGCCPPNTVYSSGQCVSTTWTGGEITGCQEQCCHGAGSPGIVGGVCVFCLNGIGACECGSACPNAPTASAMVVSAPGIL